jgi:hypothetical protein
MDVYLLALILLLLAVPGYIGWRRSGARGAFVTAGLFIVSGAFVTAGLFIVTFLVTSVA